MRRSERELPSFLQYSVNNERVGCCGVFLAVRCHAFERVSFGIAESDETIQFLFELIEIHLIRLFGANVKQLICVLLLDTLLDNYRLNFKVSAIKRN